MSQRKPKRAGRSSAGGEDGTGESGAPVDREAPEGDTTEAIAAPEALEILPASDTEAINLEAAPTGDTETMALPTEEAASDTAPVIELADARAEREGQAAAEAAEAEGADEDEEAPVPFEQLEPLLEGLLFAADRPLGMADLKRLSGEKDSRLITQALESLSQKRAGSGIQIASLAGGFCLRTNPAFAPWIGKLLVGKPVRLSRAMLETLAIVAYRQPITRPEMDDIRGVDCGPVLKTLLDRGLVRIIGKKEEVGRPMLYGTTPEFLRIFSLKDLTQLPTLRQFHELSAEHQAQVNSKHPSAATTDEPAPSPVDTADAPPLSPVAPLSVSGTAADPDEDSLLDELEQASDAASRAAAPLHPPSPEEDPAAGSSTPPTSSS